MWVSHRFLTRALLGAGAFLAFGVAPARAFPPLAETGPVTGVTASNATLHTAIGPNGLPTVYKLQNDTTGNFKFDQNDSCPLHPPGIVCAQVMIEGDPLPPGLVEPPESTLPTSTEPRRVKVNLGAIGASLEPETTYHFRVIAANEDGFAYGVDQTFRTPSALAPVIEAESVSEITATDATLEATIDPKGRETTYEFVLQQRALCELAPSPCEPLIRPPWTSSGTLPDTSGPQKISVDLDSAGLALSSGYFYEFVPVASNEEGTVHGEPVLFEAAPDGVIYPEEEPPVIEESQGTGEEERQNAEGGDTAGLPLAQPSSIMGPRPRKHRHRHYRRELRAKLHPAIPAR
jgi:hypothetical protein